MNATSQSSSAGADILMPPENGQPRRISSFGYRNSGLAAGLLVAATFFILIGYRDLSPSYGTYVVGIASMAVLALALYVKYRGDWRLNAEIVLLLGIALQYLIAPTLLEWTTGGFEHLPDQITSERWEVKESYPGAMMIVLGYIAAYLIAAAAIPMTHQQPAADNSKAYSSGSLSFVFILGVILWVTRIFLLERGSYYQLNRSDFQMEDSRYSFLAQIDFSLGILVSSYAFARFLIRKQTFLLPVLSYLALEFVWNFFSGSRERALIVLLTIAATYTVCRRRIPAKFMAVSVLASAFLIGFMEYYRYAVANSADAASIEASIIQESLRTARETSRDSGIKRTLAVGLSRLSDLDSIAAIHLWVPSSVDYLAGETYTGVITGLVPRFLWPDKPLTIMPINKWFYTSEVGSSPTTTMGEAYMNFGWWGVTLAGVCSALLLRVTEKLLFRYLSSSFFAPTYVAFLLVVCRLHTQPAAMWICTVVKMLLLISFATFLIRFLEGLFPPRIERALTAQPAPVADNEVPN